MLGGPRLILVLEKFLLLVAIEILEVEVGRVVETCKPRRDRLLHQWDVDALPLGEPVRDDGIAVEFVILRPLLVAALAELEVALYVLKEGVEGNH